MTKSTITRERIQRIIRSIDSEAYDEEEIREWLSSDEIMELSRMALAAMGSEPVAYTDERNLGYIDRGRETAYLWGKQNSEAGDVPLYRHAQQLVVPDYPETLPCPVLLEPGLRFGKGVKTKLVLDAIQRRAEHYAELEAMTPEERAEYDAGIEEFKAMLPQPAPVVPDRSIFEKWWESQNGAPLDGWDSLRTTDGYCDDGIDGQFEAWNAAMLNHPSSIQLNTGAATVTEIKHPSSNSPVIPDGYVMVPMRLTTENGAKGVLSGEFSETKFVNCPECFGDDECETCDGSGRIEITVPVTWTTIKEIWAKGVEHFAAAPQEVKGE